MSNISTINGNHTTYFITDRQPGQQQARQVPADIPAGIATLPATSTADVVTNLLASITVTDVSQLGQLLISGHETGKADSRPTTL